MEFTESVFHGGDSLQPAPAGSLLAYLAQIPDPRGRQGRRHSLEAMLASIVCALLQGSRGYVAIAQWIHSQEVSLWHALGYQRRPPQRNAFRKLLMAVNPDHLEQAIRQWMIHCLGMPSGDELQPVAMDGKTLCGSLQRIRLPFICSRCWIIKRVAP
jgi:hypothetical protein